jgi:prepilin-type N-terminal cleavage/methylation domain-containing protein
MTNGIKNAASGDAGLAMTSRRAGRGFTLQARRRQGYGEASSGFTLLEILLAIALMALLAGVLVTGGANLLSEKPATPEAVFWKAVQQSRTAALTVEREVRLSFDAKTMAFVFDDGAAAQSLPVPLVRELTVDFLSSQPGQSSILVGGELVETQTLPAVTFYPDGTCTPFRAQFRAGGAAHVLNIDPWTCAPVLSRQESTP